MAEDLSHLIPAEHRREVAIIPVEFTREHIEDKANPGNLIEVHFVRWAKKGSGGTGQTERIDQLRKRAGNAAKLPPDQRVLNQDLLIWSVIEPYYKAWAQGHEAPTDGTPIDAMPGLTKGQVERLRSMNIRSIQDAARMTDSDCDAFGMGGRGIKQRATAFIDLQDKAAPAAEVAKLREDNEHLRGEIAEMRALLDKISAAQQAGEPIKRGPGRPRKIEAPEDAAA